VKRLALLAATAVTAITSVLLPASTALAQVTPGHVILKGGRLALFTTGKIGSTITVQPYSPANKHEDWAANHEPGGGLPGGRFGLFWQPNGMQTEDYLHGTTCKVSLVNGAPAATIMTAYPASGRYVALTYLPGGVTPLSNLELTYLGHGKVAFRPEGAHGPTADQLWLVTG
jgi:hypothetical protein